MSSDPENGALEVQIARIQTLLESNHAHVRETLARIEAKQDAITLAGQLHGDRLLKLEKDAEWQRRMTAPILAIGVTTAATWLKTFLGIG
jgi:hypothetical protein